MVEMCSDDDGFVGATRKETNDVCNFRTLNGLFRKVLIGAATPILPQRSKEVVATMRRVDGGNRWIMDNSIWLDSTLG
jgi:hypothetical protein